MAWRDDSVLDFDSGKGENNGEFRFADEDDFSRANAMEASPSTLWREVFTLMNDHESEYREEDSCIEGPAEDTDEEMDDVVCDWIQKYMYMW